MGKIRIKTLGDEELEKEQKKQAKKRIEAKKRVITESTELSAETQKKSEKQAVGPGDSVDSSASSVIAKKTPKTHKPQKSHKITRSQKYTTVAKLVDKNKTYSLNEALEVLPKLKISKFDETVELHINTTEPGISGNLTLPHGTGKTVRVAIASDELIAELEKSLPAGGRGKIDFDVLLAEPSMMPKLAKVARILGPRGLMPNPKNGTISADPERLALSFAKGQTNFKTESKNPIIHLAVGKLSFGGKKLEENIKATLSAIQDGKIRKVVLKSTMSPGIKIDYSTI